MTAPPSTPLEAYQSFAAALCEFQKQAADHDTTAALLASAHDFGFSWFSRPATESLGTEVELAHVSGRHQVAIGDDPAQLLLGLLGGGLGDLYFRTITHHPDELAPEPVDSSPSPQPDPIPLAQPEPPATQVAAKSLAAAIGGAVFELAEGDQDLTQLTDGMKAQAVQMVSELTTPQRKAFAIAFRNAFNVDKQQKSVVPLITQIRHAKFINDFTIEANGGVAA